MSENKNEPIEPEVVTDDEHVGNISRNHETTDRLTRIRSLLPSLPPSATEFFFSLWTARRETKAREVAIALARAERELRAEHVLWEQELRRADDLPSILSADSARRRQESADAELAALQAEARLEAFKKAQREGGTKEDTGRKRTRLDALKQRLLEEPRMTLELQVVAEEEIGHISERMERGEIPQELGERLIENIRDRLATLLGEL